ncbi:MAG: hypothetical protein WD294_09925 [Phycisphaeraceae bacterium]
MKPLDTRELFIDVDFTPPSLRSDRAERAARRRVVVGSLMLVALAALLVTQTWQVRTHLADHHARLVAQHASLDWQLEQTADLREQRSSIIQQLAITDVFTQELSYNHVAQAIGEALPPRVALRRLDVERAWRSPDKQAAAAGSMYPALALEMAAVGDSERDLANFVAALAGDRFDRVRVLETAADEVRPGGMIYTIRAEVPLDDLTQRRDEREIAGVY